MPSNVLDEARDLVLKRLADLEDERKRLERALAELGGKTTTRRSPGRPRGSKSTSKAAPAATAFATFFRSAGGRRGFAGRFAAAGTTG